MDNTLGKHVVANTFGMKKDLGKNPVITTCPNCNKNIETVVTSLHRRTIIGKWCLFDICCLPCGSLRGTSSDKDGLHRPDIHNQHTHTCPKCNHIFEKEVIGSNI